jgi:hypothetical protein
VTAVLKPCDVDSVSRRCVGYSRVRMSTCAPLKSPCMSGVNVLAVVIDCSSPAGNRSSGTIFRSGSGLGTWLPLRDVLV